MELGICKRLELIEDMLKQIVKEKQEIDENDIKNIKNNIVMIQKADIVDCEPVTSIAFEPHFLTAKECEKILSKSSNLNIDKTICLDYDMIVIERCFTVIQLKILKSQKIEHTKNEIGEIIQLICDFLRKYLKYADDVQMFRDTVVIKLRHFVKIFPMFEEVIQSEIQSFKVWC